MPDHDTPDGDNPRRAVEIEALRSAIHSALQAGRAAYGDNPHLVAEIAPLLSRLDDISEELDELDRRSPTPLSGDLYPFWIELARRRPR